MTTIAVDGLNEEIFRRSIESRLRQGKAGEAVAKLRTLIEPYAGPGRILPERFLTVSADDLTLHGWEGLGESIRRHDKPGRPVTAVSISFGWAGETAPAPDANGHLSPYIETGYFTDDAFPFSQCGRDDLLDGYSWHGCTWADESEATDTVLSLNGIDDLHGALATLEAQLLASDAPDEEGVRAGSLGACLLSALLYQAVSTRIDKDGLPRPLCVLSGSNGVYPYFDAPVVGIPEDLRKAAEDEDETVTVSMGVPAPRYSSLLMTGIPRAKKRAVLVVEESEEETALRIAALRNLNHRDTPGDPAANQATDMHPPLGEFDTGIVPAPDGPLLAKKHAGHGWDFRSMLGPRDPDDDAEGDPEVQPPAEGPEPWAAADEPAPRFPAGERFQQPIELAPDVEPAVESAALPDSFEPADDWASSSRELPDEPADLAPLPAAEAPVPQLPPVLDPSVQERLQSLVSPAVAKIAEPEPEPEPAPALAAAWPAPPETLGPAWPLGLAWLEDAQEQQCAETALFDEDAGSPRPGIWARLLRWLTRR